MAFEQGFNNFIEGLTWFAAGWIGLGYGFDALGDAAHWAGETLSEGWGSFLNTLGLESAATNVAGTIPSGV